MGARYFHPLPQFTEELQPSPFFYDYFGVQKLFDQFLQHQMYLLALMEQNINFNVEEKRLPVIKKALIESYQRRQQKSLRLCIINNPWVQ